MKRILWVFGVLWVLASAAYAQIGPGSGVSVQQGGTTIVVGASTLNFSSGAIVSQSGNTASIAITGGTGGVTSFNSRTGTVTLQNSDVTGALGFTPAHSGANTDITSLAGLTTALSAAQGGTGTTTSTGTGSVVLAASPALTGTPTVPTAAALTSNTQAASTAYVDSAVSVVSTAASIPTNAALLALSTSGMSSGTKVLETGYYAVGDMPSAVYIFSTSSCTLASGAGDGGSQKPASPSGCWNLAPQPSYDPRIYGTKPILTIKGYISGTNLTVTTASSLPIQTNMYVVGDRITASEQIVSQTSGTPGGTGVYVVTNSLTVGSSGSPISMNAGIDSSVALQSYFTYLHTISLSGITPILANFSGLDYGSIAPLSVNNTTFANGSLVAFPGSNWTTTTGLITVASSATAVTGRDFTVDCGFQSNCYGEYIASTTGNFLEHVLFQHWWTGGNGVVVDGGKVQSSSTNSQQFTSPDTDFGLATNRSGCGFDFINGAADSQIVAGNMDQTAQPICVDKTSHHIGLTSVHLYNGGSGTPLTSPSCGTIYGYAISIVDPYLDSCTLNIAVTDTSRNTPNVTIMGGRYLYNSSNATLTGWIQLSTTDSNTNLGGFNYAPYNWSNGSSTPLFATPTASGNGSWASTVNIPALTSPTQNIDIAGGAVTYLNSLNFGGQTGPQNFISSIDAENFSSANWTYSLPTTDCGGNVNINNGSNAGTIQLPASTLAGCAITFTVYGSGAVTVVPLTGATLPNSVASFPALQYQPYIAIAGKNNGITAAVASGGTGYVVGDVLSVTGGTYTNQAQLKVTTVSSGVITAATLYPGYNGNYTAYPSNPVNTTGGTGTGATFNITWPNTTAAWTILGPATQNTINALSANYTVQPNDYGDFIVYNNASNSYTVTLPATIPPGFLNYLNELASGTNTITLTATSPGSLNGTVGGSVTIGANTFATISEGRNASNAAGLWFVTYPGLQVVSNSPTGAYTFAPADCSNIVNGQNGSSAVVYTIPILSISAPQGCDIHLYAKGSGVITLTGATGTLINNVSAGSIATIQGQGYELETADGTNWGVYGGGVVSGSTYNPNAVAITGGTINGTSVGATTPSTGAFTTLAASSTATLVNLGLTGNLTQSQNTQAVTGTGAVSLTVGQIDTGFINRTGLTGAATDTLPTASAIVAAFPAAGAGASFTLQIANNTSYQESLTGASGTTVSGTSSIQAGTYNTYLAVMTPATPAVTFTYEGSGLLASGGAFTFTSNMAITGTVSGKNFGVNATASVPANGIYSTATNQLAFATNTTAAGLIDANQHYRFGGSGTPTITSGNCGALTNGSIAAGGNDQAFEVVIGAATTTSCTITFASAFTTAPRAAELTPANATAAAVTTTLDYVSALSTTSLTISGTALASTSYYVMVQ